MHVVKKKCHWAVASLGAFLDLFFVFLVSQAVSEWKQECVHAEFARECVCIQM